jgi:hypothetical protein
MAAMNPELRAQPEDKTRTASYIPMDVSVQHTRKYATPTLELEQIGQGPGTSKARGKVQGLITYSTKRDLRHFHDVYLYRPMRWLTDGLLGWWSRSAAAAGPAVDAARAAAAALRLASSYSSLSSALSSSRVGFRRSILTPCQGNRAASPERISRMLELLHLKPL